MTRLEPMGDQGVLARCDDEAAASAWAAAVRRCAYPWLLDVVQAYTSVAVFHDLSRVRMSAVLAELSSVVADAAAAAAGATHVVPVCYEMGPDLGAVAKHAGVSADEVVRLHTSVTYAVYAIGFCPGFPYLGYLDERLCGVPRLPTPRLRVEPGSVGLTGRQTGIYTEPRPGGWNLVGRTPLTLVDVEAGYFPLRTGDFVRFAAIGADEFAARKGERLPEAMRDG